MLEVMCPECDEPIPVKDRRQRLRCPACGTSIDAAKSLRSSSEEKKSPTNSRPKSREDDDEEERKRPRRRKRRRGDEPDDDDAPSESGGRRGWVIGLVIAAAVVGLVIWIAVTGVRVVRERLGESDAPGGRPVNQPLGNPPPGNQSPNAPNVQPPFEVDPKLSGPNGPVYLVREHAKTTSTR